MDVAPGVFRDSKNLFFCGSEFCQRKTCFIEFPLSFNGNQWEITKMLIRTYPKQIPTADMLTLGEKDESSSKHG